RVVAGASTTGESVAADATVRDAAIRLAGGDSITGESVAADATFWERATVWEGATVCKDVVVGSNAGAVAGAGAAFWVDANAEAVAGNGAFWEDDRRSPTTAFDLELDSDPIGSGAQPTKPANTNPANNATSASDLPKRVPCDMG